MIDTIHTVETPEGVELDLPVAGPVIRLLAWALDLLVQGITYVVVLNGIQMLAPVSESAVGGLRLIALFLVHWFYGVAWEVANRGQTPGKWLLGLAAVREDGTPIRVGDSILRNFLRIVDWLPYCYALGLLSMLVDRSFRRLGDLAAGTVVVYARRTATPTVPPQSDPLPPPIALEPDERRAVIAFAERAPHLSTARADELAGIPAPLLPPGTTRAREQLLRIAAWLLGTRAGELR